MRNRFSSGLLARSPRLFGNAGNIEVERGSRADGFAIPNIGIRFLDCPLIRHEIRGALVLPLSHYDQRSPEFSLGIYIIPSGSDYLRDFSAELALFTRWKPSCEYKSIYIRKWEAFKRPGILHNRMENYTKFDLSQSNTHFGLVFNDPSDNACDPIHQTLRVSQNQTGYIIFTSESQIRSTFLLVTGKTRWLTPWATIFERRQSPLIFESLRDIKRLTQLIGQNPQHQVSVVSGPLKLEINLKQGPGDHLTAHVYEHKVY